MRSTTVSTTNTQITKSAARGRWRSNHSPASARMPPATSPHAISLASPSVTAKPKCRAEKTCSATWRNACTQRGRLSASASGCRLIHGATTQTPAPRNSTKLITVALRPAAVELMTVVLACEPFVGSLPAGEPAGRELRPPFWSGYSPRFDRSWDALTYNEREPSDARGVVARDDVFVPPLHHSFPERVVEVGRVDQHEGRLDALALGGKQSECLLESFVVHLARRRQPLQLERPPGSVVQDHSPLVPCDLYRLRLHCVTVTRN